MSKIFRLMVLMILCLLAAAPALGQKPEQAAVARRYRSHIYLQALEVSGSDLSVFAWLNAKPQFPWLETDTKPERVIVKWPVLDKMWHDVEGNMAVFNGPVVVSKGRVHLG